jgi:2'-5' RNA ligase
MKNQIRAFVAVPLAPVVRGAVEKLIRTLKQEIDGVKWVDAQNLHITLKFLGDVPMTELHRIIAAVQRGVESVEAFDLAFCGCGVFPNSEQPKTLWIGCGLGSEELTTCATAIENELFKLGFPKEHRRFSPHLTIGRAKRDTRVSDAVSRLLAERSQQPFGSCDVDEVIVYSSELTRNGPIYDELATIPLH